MLAVWRENLTTKGIEVEGPIDHGVFSSIYFYDPNGYRWEFAASDQPHAILKNGVSAS